MSFCDWLISLIIKSSMFTHIIPYGRISIFFRGWIIIMHFDDQRWAKQCWWLCWSDSVAAADSWDQSISICLFSPSNVSLLQMSPAGAISMTVMGYVRSLNKKLASRTVVSTRPRGSWISGHPMLQFPIKTSSAQAGSSSASQQHPR